MIAALPNRATMVDVHRFLASLLAALAVGCYAPTFEPGQACSPSGGCPSGQRCDVATQTCVAPGAAIDAAIDATIDASGGADGPDAAPSIDAALSDRDGDGVADAIDDCPDVRDPDQRDHDLDQIGDLCDNCPGIANPGQENTTEPTPDGVGDACDPWPVASDHVAVFDGFDGPTLGTAWTADRPVTFAGGRMVMPTDANLRAVEAYATHARIAFEIGVDVTGFLGDRQYPNFGPWLECAPIGFTRFGCYLEKNNGDGSHYVELAHYVDLSWTGLGSNDLSVIGGATVLRLSHVRRDPGTGDTRCVGHVGTAPISLTAVASPPAIAPGPPCLHQNGTTGTIDWAVIYISDE